MGAAKPLSKPMVLLALRQLRREIEGEAGRLSEEQTLLLVDVCQALDFHPGEMHYVVGSTFDLVSRPLSILTDNLLEERDVLLPVEI
jgi:hypothetical protein